MIELLSSVNKIAIFAFLATLVAIIAELIIMKRNTKKKAEIIIPEFDPAINATPLNFELIQQSQDQNNTDNYDNNQTQYKILFILLAVLILSLVFIITFIILNKFNILKTEKTDITAPIVKEIESKGIEIFDQSWQIIPEKNYSKLKVGDVIYIGLYTIQGAPINKARIRINESNWTQDHETADFNSQTGVYYRTYLIGAYDDQLIIEAELHSQQENWLVL